MTVTARLVAALLSAVVAGGCASCPPQWADALTEGDGAYLAAGSAGEVFVDASATNLALTRAARRLADALGLDVEVRLSVVLADGRLFVEAVGEAGPVDALDALTLVDLVECDGRTHALVRLPRD